MTPQLSLLMVSMTYNFQFTIQYSHSCTSNYLINTIKTFKLAITKNYITLAYSVTVLAVSSTHSQQLLNQSVYILLNFVISLHQSLAHLHLLTNLPHHVLHYSLVNCQLPCHSTISSKLPWLLTTSLSFQVSQHSDSTDIVHAEKVSLPIANLT